ncbi:hypothetical protein CL616_03895 [archaeon]|nr:hypothetical protein [archaeon]|tara:strand:- start:1107 stop:1634 length:528 start_codon:yes stop_codon:yes gene_type:complete
MEIISLVIMTVVLGYIFTGYIIKDHLSSGFSWDGLKFAMIVAAPAVVFHELGHKFVAMALGHSATFFVYWWGLGLALVLKLISSPLLILAPAYVSIPAGVPAWDGMWIAFAGPLVNLALFGISALVLKYKKKMSQKEFLGWTISKKLNIFLFIFNMIPLPPLDGSHVLSNLLSLF